MSVDAIKLEGVLRKLAKDVGGYCCDASVFIGEIDGKPVYLTVYERSEAEDCHDYEGTRDKHNCIMPPPQNEGSHK